jgi:hypothetical protein
VAAAVVDREWAHRWLTLSSVPLYSPQLAELTETRPSLGPSLARMTECDHLRRSRVVSLGRDRQQVEVEGGSLERVEVRRLKLGTPRVVLDVGVVLDVEIEDPHRPGREGVERLAVALVRQPDNVEHREDRGHVGLWRVQKRGATGSALATLAKKVLPDARPMMSSIRWSANADPRCGVAIVVRLAILKL